MSRADAGALILLYHRVTRLGSDPQLLSVTPEHFEQHLRVLRRCMNPVALRDVVAGVRAGKVPERAVAITFDDGYADNAIEADPLLARHCIPATVFATTAHTGTTREFFWDDLERIFLSPGQLPQQLKIAFPGGAYIADLGDAATYTHKRWESHRSWNVLDPGFPSSRQCIYSELCQLLHRASVEHRQPATQQLHQWAESIPERSSHRMISENELANLVTRDLIEIGGHSVDHPCLGIESAQSQLHQITHNKRVIESMLSKSIDGFSYPFGTRHDFTAETVSLVKQAGYSYACANFRGRVTSDSDIYQLPRLIVRDWSGEEFEERLERWLGDNFEG
jgi:peptidoglycan/xylan/chitin deacetylase (PgdA/CDA1 family)